MSSYEDPDDAMFDEALEMMDEQDRAQQQKQAQLEELVESTMREGGEDPSGLGGGGAGSSDEAQLMGAVTSLLDFLKQGPDALEKCPESEMDRIQGLLNQTLQHMRQNATPEEMESISKCESMLQQASSTAAGGTDAGGQQPQDEAKAAADAQEAMQHVLQSLKDLEGLQGAGGAPMGEDAEKLRDMLEKTVAHKGPVAAPATAPASTSAPAEPAAPTADDAEALKMIFELLQPETVIASFRAMVEAFPVYMAAHLDHLNDSERQRLTGQQQQMQVVLRVAEEGRLDAALQADASDEDKDRLLRFASALEELQKFGIPPPELQQIIEQQRGTGGSTAS